MARRGASVSTGLALGSPTFLGQPTLTGRLRGVPVNARERMEVRSRLNEAPTIEHCCDVVAQVRVPLPAGLTVRGLRESERVMPNLSAALSSRGAVLRESGVFVRAGDVQSASAMLAPHRVRAWFIERFRNSDTHVLIAQRLTVRDAKCDTTDELIASIEQAVDLVLELEDTIAWHPEEETAWERPDRAIDFERPGPADVEEDTPPAPPTVTPAPRRPGGADLLDAMLHELDEAGEVDETGSFTVDADMALRKLREHRVDRREVYGLEVLRAALARGATVIDVQSDADGLSIEFDGEPFALDELRSLYAHALSRDPDPRIQSRRALALALEGAVANDPKEVRFTGPGGTIRRRPGRPDAFEDPIANGPRRSLFRVTSPRLRNRHGAEYRPVLDRMADHARFVGARVTVGGDRVPPRTFAGEVPLRSQRGSPGVDGVVGFAVDESEGEMAQVWLGRDRVWVERIELPHAPPGLRGVVWSTALRTDLSGQRIVRDGEYERAMRAVLGACVPSVARLGRSDQRRTEDLARRLRRLITYGLDPAVVARTQALAPDTAAGALVRARVWPTLEGPRCSLSQLRDRRQRDDELAFVDATVDELTELGVDAAVPDDPALAHPVIHVSALDDAERRWFAQAFAGWRRRTQQLFGPA